MAEISENLKVARQLYQSLLKGELGPYAPGVSTDAPSGGEPVPDKDLLPAGRADLLLQDIEGRLNKENLPRSALDPSIEPTGTSPAEREAGDNLVATSRLWNAARDLQIKTARDAYAQIMSGKLTGYQTVKDADQDLHNALKMANEYGTGLRGMGQNTPPLDVRDLMTPKPKNLSPEGAEQGLKLLEAMLRANRGEVEIRDVSAPASLTAKKQTTLGI